MNKKYLPFYESLKDDDKEFWLNCSKEELIDHIVSNIRNGETLLLRINEAIELLEKYGLVDENGNFNTYLDTIDLKELYEILKGSE